MSSSKSRFNDRTSSNIARKNEGKLSGNEPSLNIANDTISQFSKSGPADSSSTPLAKRSNLSSHNPSNKDEQRINKSITPKSVYISSENLYEGGKISNIDQDDLRRQQFLMNMSHHSRKDSILEDNITFESLQMRDSLSQKYESNNNDNCDEGSSSTSSSNRGKISNLTHLRISPPKQIIPITSLHSRKDSVVEDFTLESKQAKESSSAAKLDANHNRNDVEYEDKHAKNGEKIDDDKSLSDYEEDGEDERWSVRVRLMSAVDLPSSLVPGSPLCPFLKFGLLTVREDLNLKSDEYENEENWVETYEDGILEGNKQFRSTTKKYNPISTFRTNTPLKSLASSNKNDVKVQHSSGKVLSQNDNGMMEWNEEFRWDNVSLPLQTILAVELSARSVVSPPLPSPPISRSQSSKSLEHLGDSLSLEQQEDSGGILGFWRKKRKSKVQSLISGSDSSELEAATAAANVARFLMKKKENNADGNINEDESKNGTSNSVDVLQSVNEEQEAEDFRLGTLLLPLCRLPLEDERPTVEKWYALDAITNPLTDEFRPQKNSNSAITKKSLGPHRSPSILLEVSFSNQEELDESEDEAESFHRSYENLEKQLSTDIVADKDVIPPPNSESPSNSIFNRRSSLNHQNSSTPKSRRRSMSFGKKSLVSEEERARINRYGPRLEPGIVDYAAVVGAPNPGNLDDDDGCMGWVKCQPDCCVLEQFPSSDVYHANFGRETNLPEKVEWWCFPEGCKIWRGPDPPTHMDMNLKRFSASSPPTMASSIAAFDACLNCTTSFMWWVLSSTTDEYGALAKKTYGAVIRFYAPAPLIVNKTNNPARKSIGQRLWCPMGICLTSRLPIIGILEALLLRLCEKLTCRANHSMNDRKVLTQMIHQDIFNLIINFQAPIPGVVNCSIPFLSNEGDRLLLTLSPPHGLPALPHGASVTSVCRLLGAEGLTMLLAAVLTECKILVHSADIANLGMVAEVVTALMYPFNWQLPYLPVLPLAKLEIVEAPLSYFIGIPSSSMKWVDPSELTDVVVIDLDRGVSSSNLFDDRPNKNVHKKPFPLPSSVSTKICKAIFKLLREEEEVEEQFEATSFLGTRHLPRLESESPAEREFRIAVALEICSLLRGYDECLFYVTDTQPSFDREKFLQQAPVLFEDRKGSLAAPEQSHRSENHNRMSRGAISPRSKRFLSGLLNTQHFHGLLERLESKEASLFHHIMEIFENERNDESNSKGSISNVKQSSQLDMKKKRLGESLDKIEQEIPTFHINRISYTSDRRVNHINRMIESSDASEDSLTYNIESEPFFNSFSKELLTKNVERSSEKVMNDSLVSSEVSSLTSNNIDIQPWRYCCFLDVNIGVEEHDGSQESDSLSENYITAINITPWPKLHLKQALGERKFRAWKLRTDGKNFNTTGLFNYVDPESAQSLDLRLLSLSVESDTSIDKESGEVDNTRPEDKNDLNERDVVRRCLESSNFEKRDHVDSNGFNGRRNHLISQAEAALRNASAQRFLISVLSQRPRFENLKKRRMATFGDDGLEIRQRQNAQSNFSRLNPDSYNCLLRLCNAMLEACMQEQDYESAYRLLSQTSGFCVMIKANSRDRLTSDPGNKVVFMTKQISMHPIFAEFRLWERVMLIHKRNRAKHKNPSRIFYSEAMHAEENVETDEYEAAVSTLYEMLGYGVPADDLGKFATRIAEERFFSSEKIRQLPMLVRRLILKYDDISDENSQDILKRSDLEGLESSSDSLDNQSICHSQHTRKYDHEKKWHEVAWFHPTHIDFRFNTDKQSESEGSRKVLNADGHLGKSSITSLTSFGSSVVATGALDGSVFLAHTIHFPCRNQNDSTKLDFPGKIEGVRLEWGDDTASKYSQHDNGSKLLIGSVNCLISAKGSSPNQTPSVLQDRSLSKEEEDFLSATKGCRVIAGTSGGNLRVWSLEDVYISYLVGKAKDHLNSVSSSNSKNGTSLNYSKQTSDVDNNLIQFTTKSLIGNGLAGHRGGVRCLDVPTHIYRPDSLVSGGDDGLIKVWMLRQSSQVRSASIGHSFSRDNQSSSRHRFGGRDNYDSTSKNSKVSGTGPQDVLTGHGGKVLCVKSAWHGDRLLSGGADRTLRLWDLSGSSSKCILTMNGHNGSVTHTDFWGKNTIISASADRSIALWDPRAGSIPLFILRHHKGPISDLYLKSRVDFKMVSAAADGIIATWDFRKISGKQEITDFPLESPKTQARNQHVIQTIRNPVREFNHCLLGETTASSGVLLSGGIRNEHSFLSVGIDRNIKEWDVHSDVVLTNHETGHLDAVSCLSSFSESEIFLRGHLHDQEGIYRNPVLGGTITASWDGTIRLRRLSLEHDAMV